MIVGHHTCRTIIAGHGLCGSHLLRELTFIVDSNQYRWARNIKRVLSEMCHIVSKREDKCLAEKEYANLQKRYRNILTRGSKELPEIPLKPKNRISKMEKMLKELEKVMPYKETTDIGDIILIAGEPDLLLYALVSDIERDTSRRDEWWHLKMQMLTMPPQEAVWTVRTPQMTGMEVFTMGGEKRFIKALDIGRTMFSPPRQNSDSDEGDTKVSFKLV